MFIISWIEISQDSVYQKLLKLVNFRLSYSKNKKGDHFDNSVQYSDTAARPEKCDR